MVEIRKWMDGFLQALNENFKERIAFVGLQGSYARGEATKTSDIDVVVIFDELTFEDIKNYNLMLDKLPHRDLICGFISGKNDLLKWEASDLFQFYYDTTPIVGNLDELLDLIDEETVNRAIKTGACNIYHACVHNMLYDKNEAIIKDLYKSASFVLYAIAYKQTGKYVRSKSDLIKVLTIEDKTIAYNFIALKNGSSVKFDEMSEALFTWSKKWIKNT